MVVLGFEPELESPAFRRLSLKEGIMLRVIAHFFNRSQACLLASIRVT
jgi:hypothetical protein